MKQFISFIRKEFFHIFRDKRTMLILLAMPIILIILFGYAITTEIKCVPIAVFDQSRDEVSRKITEHLGASEYFDLYKMVDSEAEAQSLFKQGKIKLVVVFPPQYASTADADVQLLADATDPNEATQLTAYATTIIASAKAEIQGNLLQPEEKAQLMQAGITPGHSPSLQPHHERSLQLCAGGNGIDINTDKCPDDLRRHREGEGDGYDGSVAGFADEAGLYHSGKSDSLSFIEYSECGDNPCPVLFPAEGSDCGEPGSAGGSFHPVCPGFPLPRSVDIDDSRHATGCHAD